MGKGTVWIFALAEEGNGSSGEVAIVGEGLEGCVKAEWGSRSRDILIWSDYGVSCDSQSRERYRVLTGLQIRLTIYDLVTGMAHVIQYPKSHISCMINISRRLRAYTD